MVAVYYEALCPDSKNFIIRQLQPAYQRAPSLIDFQLVPYGKATVSTLTKAPHSPRKAKVALNSDEEKFSQNSAKKSSQNSEKNNA